MEVFKMLNQLPVFSFNGSVFSFVCGRDFVNVQTLKRELVGELTALCDHLIDSCANMAEIREALARFIEANNVAA